MVKNLLTNVGHAGDGGSVLGLGRIPWRREWQPTSVFLPGKSHRQRSLVGFSSGSRKELDTTEHGQRGKTTSRYWIKTKKAIYKKSREPLDDINPVNT